MPLRKVKPGDAVSASGWNSIVDALGGGIGNSPPGLNSPFSATILGRNDTGEDLDRYDCVSLGDPLFELQADGSADLVFIFEKADPDKPAAILTEAIAHDATTKRLGRAWIYGLAYANVGPAAAVTDLTAAPDPTNNRLAPGSGNVRLLAAPSITVEKLLPVMIGATTEAKLAITPGGGIAARSGSTISSAMCTLVTRSGSTISTGSATRKVWNLSTTAVGATKYIVYIPTNIGNIAVWEDC